ncbi:hypothetical protein [Burkholderia sp. Ac-20353]|nr:hypothetical protein [Burkholderia sp. Ac-20353]
MLDCCSRRTAFAAIAMLTLGLIGWHRIERLLASIPDSNDDFGMV